VKTFKITGGALLLLAIIGLLVLSRRSRPEPPQVETVASPASEARPAVVPLSPDRPRLSSATRAQIIGLTNFAELSVEQRRRYEQVVAPGVSNFIALLQLHGASRFDPQPLGSNHFISLHDPKPGYIWDLLLQGNNGREYFLRFNETQEMGIIAGLTNVVSFFPRRGPSIQGVMSTLMPNESAPAIEVESRSADTPEPQARKLSRKIMSGLGCSLDGLAEYSTTSERAGGVPGAYVVTFRPKGLDRPDNNLYDSTLGFVRQSDGALVLDTFTHNSARLLPPQCQQVPPARLAVPRF
jgi:hypothetical protein